MEYRRKGEMLAIRLDEGDEIAGCLRIVCAKEGIRSAYFSGIGACREAEISHYDTKMNAYHNKKLDGMLEILSLIGNVTDSGQGEPLVHAHIVLGLCDFSVSGGHLVSAEINPTAEISMHVRDIRIGRTRDNRSGLNIQRF
ncbi:DUF296 domain-containing protein [Candidatus Micrarchaeota archaeon]|nr:DUF296 domain-containing protein [Candidatus Micrarchaeota archaeon]